MVKCFIALKNGRALYHISWLYYCFVVQYYDKVFHFSYKCNSIATHFVTTLLFSRSILLFSCSILHNHKECNIQIWYSWTNGMHTKIHCSTFWRVWHTLTARKLTVTFLRRFTPNVKCVMSCNLVHIHPLYVFVSVVGTFWSCARLLFFFPLLFCLLFVGLTLFGPWECIVLFGPSRCLRYSFLWCCLSWSYLVGYFFGHTKTMTMTKTKRKT
jgi:hypothetical protein